MTIVVGITQVQISVANQDNHFLCPLLHVSLSKKKVDI